MVEVVGGGTVSLGKQVRGADYRTKLGVSALGVSVRAKKCFRVITGYYLTKIPCETLSQEIYTSVCFIRQRQHNGNGNHRHWCNGLVWGVFPLPF